MTTSLSALEIRRKLGRGIWSSPEPFGPDGWRFLDLGGDGAVIVSVDEFVGEDWIHASMSRKGRVPDYSDLKLLHAAVFGDGWAYQVFAPPAEHINLHEYVLHLWGKLSGAPALPDFAGGTGSI